MRILSNIFRFVLMFLRFCIALYLTLFRGGTFCKTKLANYTLGFLKLSQCRIHVCQYQAMKKTKGCECGKIRYGQLYERN